MVLLLLALAAQVDGPVYRVSDRDGFLDAVGSDRTIIVEEGAKIVLSFADDFPPPDETGSFSWSREFDGSSPLIQNVENLAIVGAGDEPPSLLAEPRYVFVLMFENCRGVTLENLNLAHTDGGYCTCGVLGLYYCEEVDVNGCLLYGCGTEGLTVFGSTGITMTDSHVASCTYGLMTLSGSDDLEFRDCVFRDSGEFYGVDVQGCSGVSFDNCLFRNNYCRYTPGFFYNDSEDPVRISNCVFDSIECPRLWNIDNFILEGNEFSGILETGQAGF